MPLRISHSLQESAARGNGGEEYHALVCYKQSARGMLLCLIILHGAGVELSEVQQMPSTSGSLPREQQRLGDLVLWNVPRLVLRGCEVLVQGVTSVLDKIHDLQSTP